jgi:hypothetical protein
MPSTTPAIGTILGREPRTATLAGWARVATGDGRYVVTKSGVCFNRSHDESIPTDLAWAAVNAYCEARA